MPDFFLNRAQRQGVGPALAAGLIALSLPNGGYYPRAIAIATLIVWWIVLVGCASGALPRARVGRAALLAAALLGAYALWTGVSLIWSEDVGGGFVDAVRASGYAGLGLVMILAVRAGSARQLLAGLAAGTSAVVAIGLISRYFPGLFDTGRAELRGIDPTLGRLSFPLGYWNAYAGMAALNILLLAGFAAGAEHRRMRALSAGLIALPMLGIFLASSRGAVISVAIGAVVVLALAQRRERWVVAALPPAALGGVLLVLAHRRPEFIDDAANSAAASQGHAMLVFSLLAVLIGGAVVYAIDPPLRRLRPPSVSVRASLAALAAVAVVAALVVDVPARVDSFKELPDPASSGGAAHLLSASSSGRWQFWATAADAFTQDPLQGIGAGGYPEFWDKHASIALTIQNAHSLPLETLAETGLIGGLLLLGATVVPPIAGLRRLRRSRSLEMTLALALFAAVAGQALIDWTWQVPAVFSIAIVAAAILVGPAGERGLTKENEEEGTEGPAAPEAPGSAPGPPPGGAASAGRSRGALGLRVLAVLAAITAIGCAGVQLLGQTHSDAARSSLAEGDAARALSQANDAASIEPFSSLPRLQQALAYEMSGKLNRARAAIAEAIERAPQEWTLRLSAQRIELGRHDRAAAFERMQQMLHLNPQIPSSADGG